MEPGDEVECTVSFADDLAESVSTSASIVLENRLPTLSAFEITSSDDSVYINSTLTANANFADEDGSDLIGRAEFNLLLRFIVYYTEHR